MSGNLIKPSDCSVVANSGLVLDGTKLWIPDHRDRLMHAILWLLKDEAYKYAPITIDCALTTSCGQRCLHCYADMQTDQKVSLSRDVILRFLDDAAKIGVKAVSFVSDGESGVSPYCLEAILHGKRNGLDMAIGTNGVWLDRGILVEILKVLTYLRFTINAGTPKGYLKIHGGRNPSKGFQEKILKDFEKVCENILLASKIKREEGLDVTVGMQMVFRPEYKEELIPLCCLAIKLGADYLIIKHCSDDEKGTLGVKYGDYMSSEIQGLLKRAEAMSTDDTKIVVKWSKIDAGKNRSYKACLAPSLMGQYSGSGIVAPCGMLFPERFTEDYGIGNISGISYRDMVKGDRYWEVMRKLSNTALFDPRTMCGTLCLQHKPNEFLWNLVYEEIPGRKLRKRNLVEIESILSEYDKKDSSGIIHRNFV